MATNTINQNVNTAITDFGLIKQAIINKGVSVPTGTPTSQYGNKISSIQTGADVSNVTATAGDVDTGKVFVDSTGTEVTGSSTYKADYTALNTLVSGTTATQADVDSGKLFVKADGTQGTGSSTYKADYTALNTLVGQTTATDSDVASGKVYVKSDGTQSTGTASGGDDTEFIKMVERNTSEITIPNGVTEIGMYAFYNFGDLQTVNLPNGLQFYKKECFRGCTRLTTNTLPPATNVIYLYENCFYGCTSITTMTFPATLERIEKYAFRNCTGLTTVTFLGTPSVSNNSIDSMAFTGCTNLTTIRVPWSSGAVAGAPWGAVNASIQYSYTP